MTAAAQAGEAPLVSFDAVGKTYANGTEALRRLDMAVGKHEFVSLLGPSGCGKSTALRLIAGLGRPTNGQIQAPKAKGTGEVGFVFQEPTLMPWATVFDNVYLPFRLAGRSRSECRSEVEEAIGMVGLGGFEDAYSRELSGGMKMRVSIARALATRPRLLLMDEPFAALDEITRIKLNNDLLALWREQSWTVIFVTHSVYESVYLSSRIVVMAARPGRIVGDIAIDAPYPRDEAYRTSEPYNLWCREVSGVLRQAMEAG